MFPYKFLTTESEALEWRENLDHEETEFLYRVDRLIAKYLKPGRPVDLLKYVKLESLNRFFQCFSYILLATGLQVRYSEDYLTVTQYETEFVAA